MTPHASVITRYIAMLESFETDPAAFAEVWHPDFEHIEFPNLISKKGQTRDVAGCLKGAATGSQILTSQHFKILKHIELGEQVVVESTWTGTMAIDAGPLKAGQVLSAHICMIFEFNGDKIVRQRNYDCYEPF